MMSNDEVITCLLKETEKHLFEEISAETAHNFAHLSPEIWLCLKTAWVFNTNTQFEEIRDRYNILLENKKVDVMLVPNSGGESIRLEYKLVSTHYWITWMHIKKELEVKKPHYEVVFVITEPNEGKTKTKAIREERFKIFESGKDRVKEFLSSDPYWLDVEVKWISGIHTMLWDKVVPIRRQNKYYSKCIVLLLKNNKT